jgi:uncharacterized damage-inducible protein DinB
MHTLITANRLLLQQAIELLRSLDAATYTQPCEVCFGSTPGGHMRHVLEHYLAFANGIDAGLINYEARCRGSEMETSIVAAAATVDSLLQQLDQLDTEAAQRTVHVIADDGGALLGSVSTVQRELQFLLSHTVHHFALMHTILRSNGHTSLPEGFGVAPSTLRYQREHANAAG